MFGQVRELLTNYGLIDLLWFDGGWERTPEQWQASALHDMIRSLQPEVLINDRLPGFGDFDTPEQVAATIVDLIRSGEARADLVPVAYGGTCR